MNNKKQSNYLPRRILSALLGVIVLLSTNIIIPKVSADEVTPNNVPIIVSLGDSYSSGEGIEPFYGQNEALADKVKNEDWLAHRSEKSWGGMLSLPNVTGTMAEHRNENWFFAASSGATTKHINTKKQPKPCCYKAQINNEATLPLQIDIFDKINESVGENEVDYVTLTLGGNDAGFTDIVTSAATDVPYLNPSKVYEKVTNSLKKTEKDGSIYNNLKKAYSDICDAAGPQAKVLVAGYPKLLDPKGSGFLFGEYDAKIINSAATEFNKAIENLVNTCRTDENMNIHFVSVEGAFEGHGAYADEPYINRVLPLQSEDLVDLSYLLLNDSSYGMNPRLENIEFPLTSAYSMHPNYDGARAYATCVQAKIKELEDNSTTTATPSIETTVSISTESNLNLVGTYWRLGYGPTNGGQYTARFEEDGRLFALHIGSDTFSTGTYAYSQNKLYIEIDYHADYFEKISNDEFKVAEAVHISNGNMMFHYYASRVTDPSSIEYFKEREEKISENNNTTTATTESTYTKPQQNSYSNTQTNYDKYGKYFGEDKYFALNDYPNAEEQPNEFMGANFQLQVTNSVCLVYDWNQLCGHYECLATDIYPNIALGKSSMTQEEFENYLGVSTKFTSKEVNSDPYLSDGEIDSATLHYDHKGYSIMVFCEDDGSIIFDKTVFWVNKSE